MNKLKKEKTKEDIIFHILSQNLSKGNKIPSERMLCEALGVSRITVRSAIDKLVGDGVLERRGRHGTRVLEIPHGYQKGPKKDRQKKVLYVYFPSQNSSLEKIESFSRTYEGIEKYINDKKDIIMSQSGRNFLALGPGEINSLDGIIVTGTDLEKHLPDIIKYNIPVVAVGYPRGIFDLDYVCCDFYDAGLLAAQKATGKYHSGDIMFVGIKYEGEQKLQPGYIGMLNGIRNYAEDIGKEVFEYHINNVDLKMNNGNSKIVDAFSNFVKDKKVGSIVYCSQQLYPFMVELEKYHPDIFKTSKTTVIATGEANGLAAEVATIKLNMKTVGIEAAKRIYEKMESPYLSPIRILIPPQPSNK